MLRTFGTSFENSDSGELAVEPQSSDCVDVFYTPSRSRLRRSRFAHDSTTNRRIKLLHIDGRHQRLTVFPINTFPTSTNPEDFLSPKYRQVERITIADQKYVRIDLYKCDDLAEHDVLTMLEDLPSCFVKNYDYGLGLKKRYRFMVGAVEDLSDCTEIMISKQHQTGIDADKETFYISSNDFEQMRKSIDRTTDHARAAVRSVNSASTRNILAERTKQPQVPVKIGRSPSRKRITEWISRGEDSLSQDEQDEILSVITKNTKSIAKTKPDTLATLKDDIELVTLETLIERYQEMSKARLSEQKWQVFLNENPFVLSLAFGYPVIKVQGQASVGGRKLSGAGDKIADFLVKNSMTNNCAIVEIKRPNTKLLNDGTIRNGTYTPSGDLVGAINQALSQKHQFEQQVAQIKENSRMHDIASYSVNCCLLIGTMPSDEDRQRSFELFRGNSKNVEIITFDELFDKLKHLRDFLASPEVEPSI